MLRVLGIPAVLITLVVGAYLSTQDMRSNGPTSPSGQQEIAQAQSATAGVNFTQAVVPASATAQSSTGCERRQSGERWYAAAVRFQLRLSAAKRAISLRPRAVG